MARVVAIRDLAEDHEVELVVAVGVDLDGAVVAAGDVRPDGFAEVADFCVCKEFWVSSDKMRYCVGMCVDVAGR